MDVSVILTQDFHGVMDHLQQDGHVDLVMLDLRMPGMNGLQGLQKLKSAYPSIPIVLHPVWPRMMMSKRRCRSGHKRLFPQDIAEKIMLQGIYKILQGETYVPVDHNTNSVMPSYYTDGSGAQVMPENTRLTQREKQVLSFRRAACRIRKLRRPLTCKW